MGDAYLADCTMLSAIGTAQVFFDSKDYNRSYVWTDKRLF